MEAHQKDERLFPLEEDARELIRMALMEIEHDARGCGPEMVASCVLLHMRGAEFQRRAGEQYAAAFHALFEKPDDDRFAFAFDTLLAHGFTTKDDPS